MQRMTVLLLVTVCMVLMVSMVAGAIEPTWTSDLGAAVKGGPSIYDGKIYVGNTDGKLYCLKLNDGSVDWNYNLRPMKYAWDSSTLRIHTRPGVYGASEGNEHIYVTTTNGYLFDFFVNKPAGAADHFNWRKRPTFDENGTPALWDGWVYFGNSGQIHRLDAASGDINQTSENLGLHIESSVSVPGTDLIWFGSTEGWIYCLSSNLKVIRAAIEAGTESVNSSPYVDTRPGMADAKLYIGSNNSDFRCIHATSFAEIWKKDLGGAVESSPWMDYASNSVVVGCNDGKLYAFNPANGDIKGTYTADAALKASPVVIGGIAYIGDVNGKLYAIKLSDMSLQWSYSAGSALTATAFCYYGGDTYLVVGSDNGKVYGFKL